MKQILLYNAIYSFIAEDFINEINEAEGDVVVRVNSPGGSVFAGWGMAAAISESSNKITVKVDGVAASMAFYLLLFAENVEALDVSRFMIHRADGYAETDEDKALLKSVNATLQKKMIEKLDPAIFEDVTGVSIKSLFEDENRKDVWLDAKQAKKIGLISKINRLSPKEQTAMSRMVAGSEFAEKLGFDEVDNAPQVSWTDILETFKQQ